MQNAKDTFYEVLQTRLAAVNAERTTVVRGLTRAGVLVVENELVSGVTPTDCFLLRWGKTACDTAGALPTVTLTCEVGYATAGTGMNGGMDRGRALAAMDAELLAMLEGEPRHAVKTNYTGSTPLAMPTRIWWGEPVFGEAKAVADRLQRTATVAVMSFEEAGEL